MELNLLISVRRLSRRLVKGNFFWQKYHLIFQEFNHFRGVVILAIVFSLIGALFEGVSVGFITSFLQGFTNPNEPPIQTGLHWFDRVFLATQAPANQRLYRLSGLLIVTTWVRGGFDYLSNIYGNKAALRLVDRLRCRLFDQLESFRLSFYSTANPGTILSTLRGEVNRVQQTFSGLSSAGVQGTKLLIYLIAMLLLSWQLFLMSVMMFGLISVSLNPLTYRIRDTSFRVPKANQAFTANALSFINGIRTVHASGTQVFERKRYYAAAQEIYRAQIMATKLLAKVQPLMEGLGVTLLVGMVVLSYRLLISAELLTAAELLTFVFVLIRAIPMVSGLNGTRIGFIAAQGAMDSVNELLRRDNKPYLEDGHIVFSQLQQSIDLQSVDFAYTTGEVTLQDITLSIKRGETTALVGASGAGKTTLADLLPRFYDPTQGRVLIDGVDIRALKISSLRRKMAIVSQDTFIFNDTARENIAYGVEDARDDDIWEAARQANALEFILALPEGFETVLGERGIRLSGGQRQRIAIARALLRNPEILILDEATSALDSVTEKAIQASLEQLAKGRTVIAIAHRLSTIAHADKVVVLEKGKIVEQGCYQALIKARGSLWKYHEMQFEVSD